MLWHDICPKSPLYVAHMTWALCSEALTLCLSCCLCARTVLFNMYDFDESGELTIDEITLMLKSTLSGLAKISADVPPTEPDIELVAQDVRCSPTTLSLTSPTYPPPLAHSLTPSLQYHMQALKKAGKDIDSRINREEFLDYCHHNPDVRSWIFFYDDPDDAMDFEPDAPEEVRMENEDEGTVRTASTARLHSPHLRALVPQSPFHTCNHLPTYLRPTRRSWIAAQLSLRCTSQTTLSSLACTS